MVAVLLLFAASNVATSVSAAPPRKPPKRVATKKPPSQRGKKVATKKGTKKPAKRPGTGKGKTGVSGKKGVSGKTAKARGTGKSSAPSKRTSTSKSTATQKPAKTATQKTSTQKKTATQKKTGNRKTLSGVSGRRVTRQDVKATSQRLKTAGKTQIKTNRPPLTSKRRTEVKDRLARARGPRFTGKVLAQGKSAFSKIAAKDRAGVRTAFKGGTAKRIQLDRSVVVYRRVGGPNESRGSPWYTDKPYVRPGNAKRALSLPKSNTAQKVQAYRLPKGTVILVGKAAPMVGKSRFGSNATGGGNQIYVTDHKNLKPIGNP